jgi:hypothetical protein
MTRKEIIELAIAVGNGNVAARREFIELARGAGFVGKPGGWIYSEKAPRTPICQGWQAFAAYARVRGWVIDRLISAAFHAALASEQRAELRCRCPADHSDLDLTHPFTD